MKTACLWWPSPPFLSADIRNESKVVSAPVEEGSFATYNKVATPLEVNVTLGIQGDDSTLQDALDTLTTLQAGTQLVSLVTPNAEYPDLNLEGFNYSRKPGKRAWECCLSNFSLWK